MNYTHVQQNNQRVNSARRDNGLLIPYLAFLTAKADENLAELAKSLQVSLCSFDELLCRGYLDSGYDGADTRLLTDAAFDRWQDNERERCGSTAAEAAEAEIAFEIASRRANEERERLMAEIDEAMPYSAILAPLWGDCDCGDHNCPDKVRLCDFYDYEQGRFYSLREWLSLQREAEMEAMSYGDYDDWD